MEKRRDIRRLALLLLYQMDVAGTPDPVSILSGMTADLLAENEISAEPAIREAALALAKAAWEGREACDKLATAAAPGWPSTRQPAMDRALIRLGCHEMLSGHAPVRVAINEAIELAKIFGSEKSPSFVNGLLDNLSKSLTLPPQTQAPAKDAKANPQGADAWLDDAKQADAK